MIRGSLALVLSMGLLVAGCSSTEEVAPSSIQSQDAERSSSTVDDVQRQPEDASAFFSIEEVVLGPDGYVTLLNFTEVSVTLDGLHLCQESNCYELPAEVVPPGGTAHVAPGDGGAEGDVTVTNASFGVLMPSNGELALYVTDSGNPERLIAYLEWGSTPHQRTKAAVARGLWLEDSFAPSGDNAIRLYRDPDSGLWLWDAT